MKYTIIIDKTQTEPVEPDAPTLDGLTIVYFEQKEAVCDNADASELFDKGNMNSSTDKGTVTYAGIEYGECVKMESSTKGYITPKSNCNVTVVFGSEKNPAKVTIDGTLITLTKSGNAWVHTFEATGGSQYEIKKGSGTSNTFLYAIVFEPINVETSISQLFENNHKTLAPRKHIENKQIIIEKNGKRYSVAGVEIK